MGVIEGNRQGGPIHPQDNDPRHNACDGQQNGSMQRAKSVLLKIKEKLHLKDGENKGLFQKFIEFFVSRLLGTVVDMAVLWVFSHLVFTGYWGAYWISPTISFEAAVLTNFVCSYYWIWKTRVSNRSRKSFWRHFIGFNLSSVAGFLVKMVFLLLFERIFHWDVVWCNLAALTISGIFNYYLAEAVVFRKKRHKSDSLDADAKEVTESVSNSEQGREQS